MDSELKYDIIVIDDDALTLELVKRALRTSNYNVLYFSNELEALSYLQSNKTRVLIVDHRMPRLDGLDLLKNLMDSGGIGADHIYLCSVIEPPKHVCDEARKLGATILSKNVFRDKKAFLRLISAM